MADGENLNGTAAEPKPAAAPDDKIRITLDKQVVAHGEKISELVFREPTGADIEAAGVPATIDFSVDPPRIAFNQREMSAMMVQLAGVPPSTIKNLSSQDWINAAWRLSRFFVPRLTI
ncbi:phage tail assembly protein [Bradyrhizobium septentrionale]|uniref:Phage tail assembly protein n=1 Tax=Bradyrhizobium septentrionale TaxID=1404411 RepID=A0A973VZM6_9BRAD|nr:phage tail assembly protein [Bradyrhizobium septentrionale]UGY13740.1 phage tail assembly protein [Bradyrhizobium septentrionale]